MTLLAKLEKWLVEESGMLMLTTYHIKFLIRRLDINSHILDIIIYTIEHSPLINDHILQFFENLRQLDDARSYVVDLSLPLRDGGVVGVEALADGGLLEHGLREGFVGFGFYH